MTTEASAAFEHQIWPFFYSRNKKTDYAFLILPEPLENDKVGTQTLQGLLTDVLNELQRSTMTISGDKYFVSHVCRFAQLDRAPVLDGVGRQVNAIWGFVGKCFIPDDEARRLLDRFEHRNEGLVRIFWGADRRGPLISPPLAPENDLKLAHVATPRSIPLNERRIFSLDVADLIRRGIVTEGSIIAVGAVLVGIIFYLGFLTGAWSLTIRGWYLKHAVGWVSAALPAGAQPHPSASVTITTRASSADQLTAYSLDTPSIHANNSSPRLIFTRRTRPETSTGASSATES